MIIVVPPMSLIFPLSVNGICEYEITHSGEIKELFLTLVCDSLESWIQHWTVQRDAERRNSPTDGRRKAISGL